MKLNIKNTILTASFALLAMSSATAQFIGSIDFSKKVGNVEVNYKYYVSGDNIRVDEMNNGAVEGYHLINLKTNELKGISPDRKIYMDVPNNRPVTPLTVKVDKTGKSKDVLGHKCTEIIVTCAEKDRKIVYWVTEGDYSFFVPMLKALNRKENQSLFFLEIPGMEKSFPVKSIEYAISSGNVVSELTADKISKTKIDAEKFKIPAEYTKFER